MKIETLKSRIENAEARIEKKQATIQKKESWIAKKQIAADKLSGDEKRWTLWDINSLQDDIDRLNKEIKETQTALETYRAQLSGEIERESLLLSDIPESVRRMQDELVTDWDEWDLGRRARLKAAYNELGYKEFFKDRAHTRADYEFMYKTDEQIHRDNVDAAKALIIDLCYRVREITGDIIDWSGVMAEIGAHGLPVLNGYIVGKQGRVRVESILAGGYNIQRLHVRVLVHEYH